MLQVRVRLGQHRGWDYLGLQEGRSLGKEIATEGPQPRGRRVSRTQTGARRDRAKFQRRILHVYQGTNEGGVAVHKTYHDKFLASDAALEKLHQDQSWTRRKGWPGP